MTGFWRSCFRRFLRKHEFLYRFFYSEFDLIVLEKQKAERERSKWDCGEPLTSGLKDPKEEPVEEMMSDFENRQYNFYLHPLGAECSLVRKRCIMFVTSLMEVLCKTLHIVYLLCFAHTFH
jgi:hypothetical protein